MAEQTQTVRLAIDFTWDDEEDEGEDINGSDIAHEVQDHLDNEGFEADVRLMD